MFFIEKLITHMLLIFFFIIIFYSLYRYYSAYLLLRKVNELLINKNICETIITEITSAAISGLKYDLDIVMTKHSTNTTDHSK